MRIKWVNSAFEKREETARSRARWDRLEFDNNSRLNNMPCGYTSDMFGLKQYHVPCVWFGRMFVLHVFDAILEAECDSILFRKFN